MTALRRRGGRLLAPCLLLQPLWGCGGGGDEGPFTPEDSLPSPVPCYWADDRCKERVPVGEGFLLPLFRTHPVQGGDTTVVRAILVVHGADRNPDAYFGTMLDATVLAARLQGTLVIAPHFQIQADGPGPNEPTWTEGGWKRGHLSDPHPASGGRVSSYEAVDQVLRLLGDTLRFPKLETVVVTGHSAGGQYAHRFAATSPAETGLPHLRFRYIVANPSTYLYLGPERAMEGGGFGLPDRGACPDYNVWHYGLEDRNSYALRLTEAGIRDRLLGRDVIYMVGTEDVGTSALDMSCGAMLQGERHYPRGITLFTFLETLHPQHHHRLVEVPGVAHSSRGMYVSQQGSQVLFGW